MAVDVLPKLNIEDLFEIYRRDKQAHILIKSVFDWADEMDIHSIAVETIDDIISSINRMAFKFFVNGDSFRYERYIGTNEYVSFRKFIQWFETFSFYDVSALDQNVNKVLNTIICSFPEYSSSTTGSFGKMLLIDEHDDDDDFEKSFEDRSENDLESIVYYQMVEGLVHDLKYTYNEKEKEDLTRKVNLYSELGYRFSSK